MTAMDDICSAEAELRLARDAFDAHLTLSIEGMSGEEIERAKAEFTAASRRYNVAVDRVARLRANMSRPTKG